MAALLREAMHPNLVQTLEGHAALYGVRHLLRSERNFGKRVLALSGLSVAMCCSKGRSSTTRTDLPSARLRRGTSTTRPRHALSLAPSLPPGRDGASALLCGERPRADGGSRSVVAFVVAAHDHVW